MSLAHVASVLVGLPFDDVEMLARSVAAKWRTLLVEEWRLGWRDSHGHTLWHAFVLAEGRTIDCARAWESLATAGVIPQDAVGDDRRVFWCSVPECECGGHGGFPFPTTMRAMVSFACLGWETIATAEALAREEAGARVGQRSRVAWRHAVLLPDTTFGRRETLDRAAALGVVIEDVYQNIGTIGLAYRAVGAAT